MHHFIEQVVNHQNEKVEVYNVFCLEFLLSQFVHHKSHQTRLKVFFLIHVDIVLKTTAIANNTSQKKFYPVDFSPAITAFNIIKNLRDEFLRSFSNCVRIATYPWTQIAEQIKSFLNEQFLVDWVIFRFYIIVNLTFLWLTIYRRVDRFLLLDSTSVFNIVFSL